MLPVQNSAPINPHDGDNYCGKSEVNPATFANGEQPGSKLDRWGLALHSAGTTVPAIPLLFPGSGGPVYNWQMH